MSAAMSGAFPLTYYGLRKKKMKSDTITKAELDALGKVFAAEIDHALLATQLPFCFQSKAKVMTKLADKGLVEQVNFNVGNDAFAAHVTGWVLTHSGRFTYCANLEEPK